jgi:transposase
MRAKRLAEVTKEDHTAVMKIWARRRKFLTSTRTRVANRLHAVILELVPSGYRGEIYANKVERLLEALEPAGAVATARKELAEELLADLRRLDAQLAEVKGRLEAVVAASGTTTTKIFGAGPVVAAVTIGVTRRRRALPRQGPLRGLQRQCPDRSLLGAEEDLPALHEGQPPAGPRCPHGGYNPGPLRHSEGRAYYDRKIAEGKTHKEALRSLKRRVSDALFAAMVADARRDREEGRQAKGGPGGQAGDGSAACAAGLHPAKPALRKSRTGANPKARPRRRAA